MSERPPPPPPRPPGGASRLSQREPLTEDQLRRALLAWLEQHWVVPDLGPADLQFWRLAYREGEPNWTLKAIHDPATPPGKREVLKEAVQWAQERFDLALPTSPG